jgi:hypothetical protein
MKYSKIAEGIPEKLGIPKQDYKDAKVAVEDLMSMAWALEDSVGSLERTKELDLDTRTQMLQDISYIISSIERVKELIEKGKND